MAFQRLDTNGDGFIDLDELIAQLPVDNGGNAKTKTERLLEVWYSSIHL